MKHKPFKALAKLISLFVIKNFLLNHFQNVINYPSRSHKKARAAPTSQ